MIPEDLRQRTKAFGVPVGDGRNARNHGPAVISDQETVKGGW